MYRTIHSTGSSRSATEEELKIGFSNDPGLETKFSAIVISRNNKPFIISTNNNLEKEKIGFAVIKKPVII